MHKILAKIWSQVGEYELAVKHINQLAKNTQGELCLITPAPSPQESPPLTPAA